MTPYKHLTYLVLVIVQTSLFVFMLNFFNFTQFLCVVVLHGIMQKGLILR